MTENGDEPSFSVRRMLKIGSFHFGSSLSDLLASAVWNRVMVADLGASGLVVGLLLALRYLLAPIGLWAGHRSDTRPLFGSRRTAYIWIGRLLVLLSMPLLPLSTLLLAADLRAPAGWLLAFVSLLVYGVGTLISGAPFQALVYESAPYARRGQANAIVYFMLVVSFAFVPILYGRLMPSYDPDRFWRLALVGMVGAAIFWVVSIVGEERRGALLPTPDPAPRPVARTFREILADPRARAYGLFLGTAALFAFMQDGMLEPFGGDVFGFDAGTTTRFNAYWGTGVLVAMIATVWATRRWRPDQQVRTTAWGLALLAAPLGLLGVAAFGQVEWLVMPVLLAFGVGFGIYTVGGVSLLMAMSRDDRAGSYLALWSTIQLVSRGLGILAGGALRDLGWLLTGSLPAAYGALFVVEALGLVACIALLRRVDIAGFARQERAVAPGDLFAVAD